MESGRGGGGERNKDGGKYSDREGHGDKVREKERERNTEIRVRKREIGRL